MRIRDKCGSLDFPNFCFRIDNDAVIRKLVEKMEQMTAEIRDLKKKNEFALTAEERREMIQKSMLQIIEFRDSRPVHGLSEHFLFLKALASGEKEINFKTRHILTEIVKPENVKRGFTKTRARYTVKFDGWAIFFESRLDLDYHKSEKRQEKTSDSAFSHRGTPNINEKVIISLIIEYPEKFHEFMVFLQPNEGRAFTIKPRRSSIEGKRNLVYIEFPCEINYNPYPNPIWSHELGRHIPEDTKICTVTWSFLRINKIN